MTFFSPVFQITIVQNLGIHNPPKTLEGQPLNKKITDQKIPGKMSRLAVNFGFFNIFAGTPKMLLQSREHRGHNLILMYVKHPPLLPASKLSITPLNSGPKWPKNAKNSKKSVINPL
jgi:hypothetical protein